MSDYYDPEGRPLTLEEWGDLLEKRHHDPDTSWWHKVTVVGNDSVEVSTVWLGMNHRFGDGPPLIYETMVFGGPMAEAQWRYSTKEEAWRHHDEVVRMVMEASRFLFVDDEGT